MSFYFIVFLGIFIGVATKIAENAWNFTIPFSDVLIVICVISGISLFITRFRKGDRFEDLCLAVFRTLILYMGVFGIHQSVNFIQSGKLTLSLLSLPFAVVFICLAGKIPVWAMPRRV